MFEYRFDRSELVTSKDESGFLRAKVKITKPGVFPYLLPDGTIRREAKLPEELYKESFIKSLDGLIVTDGHPYDAGGLVNSENYKSLMKGIILNPRIEDGFVVADEIIFDKNLIHEVTSGEKREVSLGSKVVQRMDQGNFQGQTYDSIQTEMAPNHVAHVLKGRIGPEARILLDGLQYAIQGDNMPTPTDPNQSTPPNPTDQAEPGWVKKILDGFDKLFSLFSAGEKSQSTSPPENNPPSIDPAQKIMELQNALAAMTASLGMKMDESIQRESLVDSVKAVLPDANLRGLSNLQIKKELIKSQFPELKMDSEDLVDVYYNASLAIAKEKSKLSPGNKEIKNDESDINTLRAKRLNLYVEAK
jgi:uncharacterized protein